MHISKAKGSIFLHRAVKGVGVHIFNTRTKKMYIYSNDTLTELKSGVSYASRFSDWDDSHQDHYHRIVDYVATVYEPITLGEILAEITALETRLIDASNLLANTERKTSGQYFDTLQDIKTYIEKIENFL